LRRKIAGFITPEVGRVAALLGAVRQDVRERFHTIAERKSAYQKILDSGIVNWIRDYDDPTAEAKIRDMLQEL
jgi:siroheme synthase (precorrin-2 oxidase/ferrochelatase)